MARAAASGKSVAITPTVGSGGESHGVPLTQVPGSSPEAASAGCQLATKESALAQADWRCRCQARRTAEEELAKKMEELSRSNLELEQFAFVAAHDLQEPLRMVAAYTKLLGEKYRGRLDGDADRYIEYAADGARRMQTLIHDLLSYSRVGTRDTVPKNADSAQALSEALKNLDDVIKQNNARVCSGNLPRVRASRTQLMQVFQNLIGNAIKFRRAEPPLITVEAKRLEQQWQFRVSDNGIGIPPEQADAVFGIFHRLHTRAEYPGNGIGLAICKRIVECFGGRIWLQSVPGEGTTFHFTLPAVESDEKGGAR